MSGSLDTRVGSLNWYSYSIWNETRVHQGYFGMGNWLFFLYFVGSEGIKRHFKFKKVLEFP